MHLASGRLEKGSHCPSCNYGPMDGYTGIGSEAQPKPSPGLFTICGKCGEILVFTETLGVRVPTPEEIERAKQNQGEWELVSTISETFRKKRHARSPWG
jgi:hypothetical protein